MQNKITDCIYTKEVYQSICVKHVALGLTHLDTVLTSDHALVEQLLKWLIEIDRSDVI